MIIPKGKKNICEANDKRIIKYMKTEFLKYIKIIGEENTTVSQDSIGFFASSRWTDGEGKGRGRGRRGEGKRKTRGKERGRRGGNN